MLSQIEWWIQNGPIRKNGTFPVKETLIKSWFDVLTTQTSIFVLFVSAEILFDGAFCLWVSLSPLKHILICSYQQHHRF